MNRLLLLEDDPAIAQAVAFALTREGFVVQHELLLSHARAALAQGGFAACILDVGLPDGSGLDLCRELRQSGDAMQRLPILMLSARSEEMDRVLGLELGADDYLGKPFSPRELVARVRALLRRAALMQRPLALAAARPSHSALLLDEPGQRVAVMAHARSGAPVGAGEWLALTRLEYGLLRALIKAQGRICSREFLLDAVWGQDAASTDRTVDTHIKTLRAKLRAQKSPGQALAWPTIDTHRGMGYSLSTPEGAAP